MLNNQRLRFTYICTFSSCWQFKIKMKEIEKINKLVLTADSIECKRWSLAQKENPVLCYYCKSPLFYAAIEWGIVEERELYGIKVLGKEREPQYNIREVGLILYLIPGIFGIMHTICYSLTSHMPVNLAQFRLHLKCLS